MVVAAMALYRLAFVPLYHALGETIIVLSILLAVATGLLLGWPTGLLIGLLSALLNGLLFGQDTLLSPGGLLGSGAAVLMGVLADGLNALLDRLSAQSRELERARQALREESVRRQRAEEERAKAQEAVAATQCTKTAFLSNWTLDKIKGARRNPFSGPKFVSLCGSDA